MGPKLLPIVAHLGTEDGPIVAGLSLGSWIPTSGEPNLDEMDIATIYPLVN